jgi:peptidoglycan/LPS O-acetylase OafA/YrhL
VSPAAQIPAAAPRRPKEMGIEGLRGVAACFVALSHVLYLNLLTPKINFPPIVRSIEGGHAGVLTFFVLSGYVIGWTNDRPYTPAAAGSYVRRRLIRLVPIYLLAMALTVVVMFATGYLESVRVVAGSFLCLQNYNGYFGFSLNPPMVNGPLWSLNYEVLYYGAFIALWRFRPGLLWVFGPALVAGALGWMSPGIMPLFIASYASGWIFWAAGWWLARQPAAAQAGDRVPLASWILLIFCSHHIAGLYRAFNLIGLYCKDGGMVTIADLGLLPSALLVLAALAHRRLPHRGLLEAAAWAVCAVPVAGMIFTGRLTSHADWVVGAAALALSVIILPFRSQAWLRPFEWFGGISYAFYVVHFPLLYLIRLAPFPTTTLVGFASRLVVWIALVLGISWLLERRFQPWIKGRILATGQTSP